MTDYVIHPKDDLLTYLKDEPNGHANRGPAITVLRWILHTQRLWERYFWRERFIEWCDNGNKPPAR